MKKISLAMLVFLVVFALSACSELCVGTECITGEPVDTITDPEDTDTTPELENLVFFDHIDGHGNVTEDQPAFVLFEEEMLGFVKYQITYLSCTCRGSDVNYWQVAYVEISTNDNSIQKISFNSDSDTAEHVYTAGMWGDSSPTPGVSGDYSDGKYLEDFEEDFIPWLIGQTPESLEGISVFKNGNYMGVTNTVTIDEQDLIDDFAGSSVSTNNMIRIMKTLLDYHVENHSN
jgi:hypothetical protein